MPAWSNDAFVAGVEGLVNETTPGPLTLVHSVVTVLPALGLFLALQRYYIQGLLMGSVKQ